MQPPLLRIAAIGSTLRSGSVNNGLIRAAAKLAPSHGIEVTPIDLRSLPLYDQDLEADKPNNIPEGVLEMHRIIYSSDAVLFSVAEFNYSLSGVQKNAIDWASRTYLEDESQHPLYGKPCALMGAGGGMGTGRSQYHLRQVLVFLNCIPLNKPEVFVQRWNPPDTFDAKGDLLDEKTLGKIDAMLSALAKWTKMIQAGQDNS